jgi:hypothetical protein
VVGEAGIMFTSGGGCIVLVFVAISGSIDEVSEVNRRVVVYTI